MSKLFIEFSLPEEKKEASITLNSLDYFSFLTGLEEIINNWLRGKEKCPFYNAEEVLIWLSEQIKELQLYKLM